MGAQKPAQNCYWKSQKFRITGKKLNSKILAPQGPSPKKLQFSQDRIFPEILRGRDVPGLVERTI